MQLKNVFLLYTEMCLLIANQLISILNTRKKQAF